MTVTTMNWYSLDSKLKTCEHPPIDLDRAIQIASEYYDRGTKTYESAEDAIADTMFGFSRSPSAFIELCVNGPSEISYKFELTDPSASWFRKVFGGTFQFETVLKSRDEMIQRVQEFFSLTPAALKTKLQDIN
jgi:hypothetical protein